MSFLQQPTIVGACAGAHRNAMWSASLSSGAQPMCRPLLGLAVRGGKSGGGVGATGGFSMNISSVVVQEQLWSSNGCWLVSLLRSQCSG